MRTKAEIRLLHALADELRDTGREVEELAATLSLDEELVVRFLAHLQGFDLIAQRVGESAALLQQLANGSSPEAAVDKVRLERMMERLRVAMGNRAELRPAA